MKILELQVGVVLAGVEAGERTTRVPVSLVGVVTQVVVRVGLGVGVHPVLVAVQEGLDVLSVGGDHTLGKHKPSLHLREVCARAARCFGRKNEVKDSITSWLPSQMSRGSIFNT